MAKTKGKKVSRSSSKMTSAWVDDTSTITISDDDEETTATDNQPIDGTDPANQPSTSAQSDAVLQNHHAAKSLHTKEDVITTSVDPANVLDIKPSVSGMEMSAANEKCAMPPEAKTDNKPAAQVQPAEQHSDDKPTAMFMDTHDTDPAAKVAGDASVDCSAGPSMDIPVIAGGSALGSLSSEMKKHDKTGFSTLEEDPLLSSGLYCLCSVIELRLDSL